MIVDYDQETWGAQKRFADGALPGLWRPDKWVIHWGGNATAGAEQPSKAAWALRVYEQSHLSRGWRAIGYNYAVDQWGGTYRLRGENPSGATSGDAEPDGIPENNEARAVLWIGGKGQRPSPLAKAAFMRLWVQDPLPVIGHRDVKKDTTECPGDEWLAWIASEPWGQEGDDVALAQKIFARWDARQIRAIYASGLAAGDAEWVIANRDSIPPSEVEDMVAAILGDSVARVADLDLDGAIPPDVDVAITALGDEIEALKTVLRSV